jgi:hypothetical protein
MVFVTQITNKRFVKVLIYIANELISLSGVLVIFGDFNGDTYIRIPSILVISQ